MGEVLGLLKGKIMCGSEYLNYKALKKRAAKAAGQPEDAQRAEFLFLFDRELEKVEQFYCKKLAAIERKMYTFKQGSAGADSLSLAFPRLVFPSYNTSSTCNSAATISNSDFSQSHFSLPESLVSDPQQAYALPNVDFDSMLLEHLEEIRIWIMKLTQFASLNLEGFRKVLKKYDKKHKNSTNLLGTYFSSRVQITQFAAYNNTLGMAEDFLKELTRLSYVRITDSSPNLVHAPGDGAQPDALKVIHRIWNDIYVLQVRAILETDDAGALMTIAQSLDLGKLVETFEEKKASSEDAEKISFPQNSSGKLNDKTMLFLQREYALLLRQILEGVCMHQSVQCLRSLIASGLEVTQVERGMKISLLYKVLASLPKESPVLGVVPESLASCRAAEIVEILVGEGADLTWKDIRGRNIIHRAVLSGSQLCLEKLLAVKKVELNSFDNDGCTPFFFAIQQGLVNIVQLFIAAFEGVGLECLTMFSDSGQCKNDTNPLILACKFGHLCLVSALVGEGIKINVDVCDGDGETALYHCAKRGYAECIELLLQNRANPEIREVYNGWTPLFVAAALGYDACVEKLIMHGADAETVDRDGWTAFEHAIFRGHFSLSVKIKPKSLQGTVVDEMEEENPMEECPKEYGHFYLENKKTMIINLGQRSGARSFKPPVELLEMPVAGSLNMKLRISPEKTGPDEARIVDLPIRDEIEAICFNIEDGKTKYLSIWDGIKFDLIKVGLDNCIEVIGRGLLILRQFLDEHERPISTSSMQLVVPIMDRATLDPMALVSLEVLVACPFIHENVKEKNHKMYWKSITTKIIGHRGLGANSGTANSQIAENTIMSFVMAASLGAEYVEFDVQLTGDKIPVIYHDFIVSETGFNIGVSSLSLEQFLTLRDVLFEGGKSGSAFGSKSRERRSIADDFDTLLTQSGRSQNLLGLKKTQSHRRVLEIPFSTLKEAFCNVPKETGFNIEVKYPVNEEAAEWGLQHVFEINEYCDCILSVVYEQAGDRPLIFSSFHPDVKSASAVDFRATIKLFTAINTICKEFTPAWDRQSLDAASGSTQAD